VCFAGRVCQRVSMLGSVFDEMEMVECIMIRLSS
jgi:hypothetical protein